MSKTRYFEHYMSILPLWAEQGELDKIQELLSDLLEYRSKRDVPKGLQSAVLQARVVALAEK